MQLSRLQDRIDRGRGSAARQIGAPYDAFRPVSTAAPLAPENRFIRMSAAFTPADASFRRPTAYGAATWLGIFDSAYTQPGDFLAGPGGVFFIAAQQSLLPTLCVLASRTVSISRPAAPTQPGINTYGGVIIGDAKAILTDWPASILSAGGSSPGTLPGDANIPSWSILLPCTPVPLRPADLVQDDMGRTYVIGTAELTALGWRILAKQAAT